MNDGVKLEDKKKIIAVVAALFPEAKIYLYGSRARGTYKESSDIDLALDAGHRIEPHARIGELRALLGQLTTGYSVDVIDINRVSEDMREEVDKDKVLWKE